MLILLLLYLASNSWAKDVPRDSNYTLKYVASCPETGYFFKREPAGNKLVGACYLCFCQGGEAAVCWPRENRKCDVQHYKHNTSVAKRESRVRRSPLGIGDIFFKDAARDVFNRNVPEVCKPYESSFSEGCPPVDWCTGCTVCDCDANGHWDCHILSFCDDEKSKGKKHNKNANANISYPKPRKSGRHQPKMKKTPTTRRPPLRFDQSTKQPVKKIPQKQKGPSKAMNARSFIQKGKPVKPLIIKKNENKRKFVKTSASKKVVNGSNTILNKELMKSMVVAMQKLWTKQVTAALPDIVRMVQKRSFNNRTREKPTTVKYRKKIPPTKNGRGQFYNKSLFIRKQKSEDRKKEMLRKREIMKKEANAAAMNKKKKQVTKPVSKKTPAGRSYNKPNNNKKTNKPNNKPTTNKPKKPKDRSHNKRKKREVNNNQTNSSSSYNISAYTLNPIEVSQGTALEQDTTIEPAITASSIAYNVLAEGNTLNANTKYYEYSVQETTENPGHITEYKSDIKPKIGKYKSNFTYEIPKEVANDIKLTKWSEIKMVQVKEEKTNINSNKTTESATILDDVTNVATTTSLNNTTKVEKTTISRKDIDRKVDKTTKKYSLRRIINVKNCKNKRNEVNYSENYRNSLSSKIDNLRNVLQRLLGEFRKNDSTVDNKRKKNNAIKYLKKFFNKIFFKDSNKTFISQRLRNNNHTIQMLCESFGPCIINRKNKMILLKKIRELNNETIQILKSLRIIKGLLKLVDIPQDMYILSLNKTSNFKTDVHKLNIILKQSLQEYERYKLTDNQRIQISYIKKNTKVFTQSVAKFTKILNEIIELISVKGDKDGRKWFTMTKSKPKSNLTKSDTIQKFKKLLNNYNIVHNAFISKLIEVFSSIQTDNAVEKKHDTAPNNGGIDFSKNILKNLNKLKNLASVLNPMRRQKRHVVRQDNAVEYLLMLMEYMFQQKQLDTSPVNDGIDLLIEAIKSAPDIKTVKKKVLKNSSPKIPESRATDTMLIKNISNEISASDNEISGDDSMPNKVSNEDSAINKISSENHMMLKMSNEDSISDNNSSSIDQEESNEENESQDLQLLKLKTVSTGPVDGRRKKNSTNINVKSKGKTKLSQNKQTLKPHIIQNSQDMPIKVYMGEDDVLAAFDSRLEKASGEIIKKSDIFNPEFEEDNNVEYPTVVTKAPVAIETTTELLTMNTKRTQVKTNSVTVEVTAKTNLHAKKKNDKINDNDDMKSLEWIDDKDASELAAVNITNVEDIIIATPKNVNDKFVLTTTERFTAKIQKPSQTYEVDLSDVSKEYSDEKSKTKTKKTEDVMVKKDQELLNSLDYGTESSHVDDSESKDGVEEKFLNDYFAE